MALLQDDLDMADWEEAAGISAPLYDIVDTLFELQSRGFFRRQVRMRSHEQSSIVATSHIQKWCFKTFLSILVLSLFSPLVLTKSFLRHCAISKQQCCSHSLSKHWAHWKYAHHRERTFSELSLTLRLFTSERLST